VTSSITFACKHFDALTAHELYAMLALRSQVFVVEQGCVYLDPDGLDLDAHHLFGYGDESRTTLVCGVRILRPGAVYDEASIGRVVTAPAHRSGGIGRRLMQRAIDECAALYPGAAIRIGAQQYLEGFYAGLGFVTVSAPYAEDGITHVTMLRPA